MALRNADQAAVLTQEIAINLRDFFIRRIRWR